MEMIAPVGSTRMSLASIRDGEKVRIERILFDKLKDLCYSLGIEEGKVVRCRHNTRAVLLLETGAARTIIIDQDWARFVQVLIKEEHENCAEATA
jgi:hypothetical protein